MTGEAGTNVTADLKRNLLGVLVDAIDYREAVSRVIRAARDRRPFAVTALAVHGVMEGVADPEHRYRLNHLDLVVPDGQPVRWALNHIHGAALQDRVYGPELMLRLCRSAAEEGLSVYFYGSSEEVSAALARRLTERFPTLQIAGRRPSAFRRSSMEERAAIARSIVDADPAIVFVGLGCPRQEVWAYEQRELLSRPIVAVGAAFDFHAGMLRQAPPLLQRLGLEWAFRLRQEPRRLWRRYLYLNPEYAILMLAQLMGASKPDTRGTPPGPDIGWS